MHMWHVVITTSVKASSRSLVPVSCFFISFYHSLLSWHQPLLYFLPSSPTLCLPLSFLFLLLPLSSSYFLTFPTSFLFSSSTPPCFFPPFPPSLSPLPKVYVVELMESIDLCVERNIHNRTQDEIEKVLVLQLL